LCQNFYSSDRHLTTKNTIKLIHCVNFFCIFSGQTENVFSPRIPPAALTGLSDKEALGPRTNMNWTRFEAKVRVVRGKIQTYWTVPCICVDYGIYHLHGYAVLLVVVYDQEFSLYLPFFGHLLPFSISLK
jgi:hypothetical protein